MRGGDILPDPGEHGGDDRAGSGPETRFDLLPRGPGKKGRVQKGARGNEKGRVSSGENRRRDARPRRGDRAFKKQEAHDRASGRQDDPRRGKLREEALRRRLSRPQEIGRTSRVRGARRRDAHLQRTFLLSALRRKLPRDIPQAFFLQQSLRGLLQLPGTGLRDVFRPGAHSGGSWQVASRGSDKAV